MRQQWQQKTAKETQGGLNAAHGKAKWSARGPLATKSKPTWVQQGSKKVSKNDPNERP